MFCDHGAAELGDVVVEVNQVFALLVGGHVVEVDVLVAPLEVVDDLLVGQLLLDDENVLKEVDDAFFDIKVVELSDHGLLVLQVSFVLVNQSISLVNHVSDVVEDCAIGADVQLGQLVCQVLVLFLFLL